MNYYFILTLFLGLFFLNCGKKEEAPGFGEIKFLVGNAEIFTQAQGKWEPLEISLKVDFGDSIKTSAESQVEVEFGNENTIRIAENSKVRITELKDDQGKSTIEIFNFFGTVLSNIKKLTKAQDQYLVRTPTSVAAIRGTFFCVSFMLRTRTSHVNVMAGRVWVRNPRGPKGVVVVTPGFFTVIAFGRIPGVPKKMNYGQWKKMGRFMPPGVFKKYTRKLKFKGMGKGKGPGKGSFKLKGKGPGKKGFAKIKAGKKGKGAKVKVKAKIKAKPKQGKGKKLLGGKKLFDFKGITKGKGKGGKGGKGPAKKGKKGKGKKK